jgi:predicted ATP-dependent endonuclease of OLD family
MAIKALSIKHFRSIDTLSEETKDLNILVGQNDEGKSNVLRALDLFFNGDRPGRICIRLGQRLLRVCDQES